MNTTVCAIFFIIMQAKLSTEFLYLLQKINIQCATIQDVSKTHSYKNGVRRIICTIYGIYKRIKLNSIISKQLYT